MGTLSGKHTVGDAVVYGSIYGYQKNRFPVIRSSDGATVGSVKEEIVLNGENQEVSRIYYSRSIIRPHGSKRFFDSVESLILAYGGTIDRTKKKPVAKTRVAKPAPKKARAVKKPASRAKKAA